MACREARNSARRRRQRLKQALVHVHPYRVGGFQQLSPLVGKVEHLGSGVRLAPAELDDAPSHQS
jgi:hypothetical protein